MSLPTGTITGKFVDASGDPVKGSVTIAPEPGHLLLANTDPAVTVPAGRVTVELVDGVMPETQVVATDSDQVNPSDFTYMVAFLFPSASLAPFHIKVPAGETVDLAQVAPVASSTGDAVVVGPAGQSTYQIWLAAGNTGSEQDFLAAQKGEQGDPGPQGPSSRLPFIPPAGVTTLGAGTSDATTDLAAFLTASNQTTLATWLTFTADNGTFSDAISNAHQVAVTTGATPNLEIAWAFPGTAGQSGIAAGTDDANITARAAELANYGAPVLLRLNWEMNGDWYPWAAYDGDTPVATNTPADYIAAWRHITDIIRATAPNVAMAWCPHLWTFHDLTTDQWWPGNEYVDWVGVTAYPGSAVWSWIQTGTWGLDTISAFATQHGKPMRICEWGVGQGDSPTNVGMFYQFKNWLNANPVCREIVYFHMTGLNGVDYRLENYTDWQYAYQTELTAKPARFPQSAGASLPVVDLSDVTDVSAKYYTKQDVENLFYEKWWLNQQLSDIKDRLTALEGGTSG